MNLRIVRKRCRPELFGGPSEYEISDGVQSKVFVVEPELREHEVLKLAAEGWNDRRD